MKKLVKEILEDFSSIGKDLTYPTQFIIDASELSQIGDMEWLDTKTGYIFIKKFNNGPLEVNIDGLVYYAVREYDSPIFIYQTELFTDGIAQKNGKLGFYITSVCDETISDGLCLGEGMHCKELFPNEEVIAISNDYVYDGEAEKAGLKCMTSVTGKTVSELFYGTNNYSSKDHINYDEELIEYIMSCKTNRR